jgi:hypothetical protein
MTKLYLNLIALPVNEGGISPGRVTENETVYIVEINDGDSNEKLKRKTHTSSFPRVSSVCRLLRCSAVT